MGRTITRALLRPAFVLSVLMLSAALIALRVGAGTLHIGFTKQPIPLRKPLTLLDKHRLSPLEFYRSSDLPPEIIETLGTSSFISWVFRDHRYSPSDPLHWVHVFVTYYTGQQLQVEHVPDVCYLGAGYQIAREENGEFDVPALAGLGYQDTRVPYRALTFTKHTLDGTLSPTVVYLFNANGVFVPTRNEARVRLALPGRYGYFSKVEITFGHSQAVPSREEAIRAAGDVLNLLLPVLVSEHWPDWEAAEEQARRQQAGAAAGAAGEGEPAS